MESLRDLSWQVDEQEYRADKAYSYSTISRFNREGFSGLSHLYDKIESPSLTFGSIVDTLLTGNEEDFKEQFEVASFPQLSDALIQIARTLFNEFNSKHRTLFTIPDEDIARIGASCGYYANSKYESYRVKKVREECGEYYSLLFLSRDKKLISSSDYEDACQCARVLKTDNMTKFYFDDSNPFEEGIERFYQLKFKGEYEGIPLRCMADLLIVDHNKKTITPCDLKTSSKEEWNFYKSFIDWGYWIQAQLYWYIIRQNLDKSETYKDYVLEDYRFIVINRHTMSPLVWIYTGTQAINDCCYGSNGQYKCRNWRGLVKELATYESSDIPLKYPIEIRKENDIVKYLNKD